MNSPLEGATNEPGFDTGPGNTRRSSLTRAYKRIAIAIVLSLVLHALFVSEALRGLADLWTKGEAPAPRVTARIVTPPPPPPPPPVAQPQPAPVAAPKPPTPHPAPVHRATPKPRPAPAAPPVLARADDSPPVTTGSGDTPGAASDAPAASTVPVEAPPAPPAPPAVPSPPPSTATFPTRARIDFQITRDADNLTAYGTQDWRLQDGRYNVRLEARLLFFSVAFESSGRQGKGGLFPEHYVDDRRGRTTSVDFVSDPKNAVVNEANGNRKTVAMASTATDLMSLPYSLALNPDMQAGTVLMLANRDSVDPVRLLEVRDEVLMLASGPINTRYYSFQYVEGKGNAQVWLAVDKQWLPAKLRVAGRDGPISFVATRYRLGE